MCIGKKDVSVVYFNGTLWVEYASFDDWAEGSDSK